MTRNGSLRASRVRDRVQLLFTTDTVIRVLEEDGPQTVEVMRKMVRRGASSSARPRPAHGLRLRTLDRTVISVPNSRFLDMELETFCPRDRFLFTTVLQLRYETTPDQMRYVLAELRDQLIAHPEVVPEPLRVRLMGFCAHSLDAEIFSYIRAFDIDAFAAVPEDVILRMTTSVEDAGAQFALLPWTWKESRGADRKVARAGR